MPDRDEIAYFGAGPSGLPTPVITAGSQAFLNFESTGIGLAELSHRSPTATKILADTRTALTELLDIPENYEILFCHGGGSAEFSAVVYNLVPVWVELRRKIAEKEYGADDEAKIISRVREDIKQYLRLDYLVTGSWSLKASQEAALLLGPLGGKNLVNIATDSREKNAGKFLDISPEHTWKLTQASNNGGCPSAFVYYCDNETVDGIEFPTFPHILSSRPDAPDDNPIVVCDMSSNILSRRIDVAKYGVIYAGAQKNIGITDTTIVIVRKDLLSQIPPPSFLHAVGVWSPPTILNWSIIAKNNSLYNTLPIFSVWIAKQVLKSLLATHGAAKIAGQEAVSDDKARTLYAILERHPVYRIVPKASARSRMNLCFRIGEDDENSEKAFLAGAEARGLLGLKGHRSVGGIRISNYNAVSVKDVERLGEYLVEFAEGQR